MADCTGTLWENDGAYASCDHGFASHGGVHVLFRDVLGLQEVDTVNKTVQVRFTDSRLDWCEGSSQANRGTLGIAIVEIDTGHQLATAKPAPGRTAGSSCPRLERGSERISRTRQRRTSAAGDLNHAGEGAG